MPWVRAHNSEWARTLPSETKLQQAVLTTHIRPEGRGRCPCAFWSSCLLSVSVSLCLLLMGLSRLQFQMAPFLCSTHLGVSSLFPWLCDSTMAVLKSRTTCWWFRKPYWLNCPSVTSRMKRSSILNSFFGYSQGPGFTWAEGPQGCTLTPMTFLKMFLFYICFACMYICVSWICLVPVEARRHHIPWN